MDKLKINKNSKGVNDNLNIKDINIDVNIIKPRFSSCYTFQENSSTFTIRDIDYFLADTIAKEKRITSLSQHCLKNMTDMKTDEFYNIISNNYDLHSYITNLIVQNYNDEDIKSNVFFRNTFAIMSKESSDIYTKYLYSEILKGRKNYLYYVITKEQFDHCISVIRSEIKGMKLSEIKGN